MSMEADFLYEHAPLVEVIAEVHWELVPVKSIPGSALDPHFGRFKKACVDAFSQLGYNSFEDLIPGEVPLEFLAHKPVARFRAKPNGYPLFQIGPGLFTTNIVPPYKGWASFVPTLRQGLQALYGTYPDSASQLRIQKLELRYIDAMTEKYGMKHQGRFIRDTLKLGTALPQTILDLAAQMDDPMLQTGKTRIRLRAPEDCVAAISYDVGKAHGRPAVILTFGVTRDFKSPTPMDPASITTWFDATHSIVRKLFDTLIPEEVKARFGSKQLI